MPSHLAASFCGLCRQFVFSKLRLVVLAVFATCLLSANAAPENGPWTLSTDDTVICIGVDNDQPVVLRLEDSGTHQNWLKSSSKVPLLATIWADSQIHTAQWKFQSASRDEKTGTLKLTFNNAQPRMTLRSIWRARPGHGPVEHWVEVENHSSQSVTVSQQESLFLGELSPTAPAQLWWVKRGGMSATIEGGTCTQALSDKTDLVLTNTCEYGLGFNPVPWMSLQQGEERGLYVGWEFSGLGRLHTRGGAGAATIAVGLWPEFKTDIEPAETLRIPAAFVGCYAGDVEEGSYSLHRFIVEKLRPTLPSTLPDPILAYNLYTDYGMTNATEKDVLRSARFCADLGFEAFMPDAMWFPEVGDWRWDPKRFPNGIAPIEKWVHANGMKQALWCAWAAGGLSKHPDALNTHAHPEWFCTNSPADWRPGPHYGSRLCFGSPDAKAYALKKTQQLVSDFKLDYLKHDSDPLVNMCLQSTHRHHHGVDASYWATMGYYDVQRALGEKFPHLVIESCSGGGHIKDFGIIQLTHVINSTDEMSNLSVRQSMYDSSYAFPPLVLQCYTYNNHFPVPGDNAGLYLWRSAMMGAWQIDPTDTTAWSDELIDATRQSTRLYKSWIRPMLKDVKVHHVMPRPDGKNWDGMFFWSAPLKRGTFFVFRPESPDAQRTIRLKGLAAKTSYWVWGEDSSVIPGVRTGAELMQQGLEVRLTNRLSSDIVFVREAQLGKPECLSIPGTFKLKSEKLESDYFTNTATLSWTESAFARDYRVLVSDGPDFNQLTFEKRTSQTHCSLRLPADRAFYWKVETYSTGGCRKSEGNARKLITKALKRLPSGVVFASDMAWSKSTAGESKTVCRDSNMFGQMIRAGGEYYPKGLWTHSFGDSTPADIVVDLSGHNFSSFTAEAGLDDAAGRGGSVIFQVLVDGEQKYQSPIIRLGAMRSVQVDVAGAKQLTLRVLNAGDGSVRDHAVWCMARFIEAGAKDLAR